MPSPSSNNRGLGKARLVHPLQWIWEPLETEAGFILKAMFGAKAVYLGGKIVFCFTAGEEPWRGMLVCTDREKHAALQADFPALEPHPVLSKWLYLSEGVDSFEKDAAALVSLCKKRDGRIGVVPKPKKRRGRRIEGPGRTG